MNKNSTDFLSRAAKGEVTTQRIPGYLADLRRKGYVTLVTARVEYYCYTTLYTWTLTDKGRALVAHPSFPR